MAQKKKVVRRRKRVQAGSIGLSPAETLVVAPGDLAPLISQVEQDGGAVIGSYRDPFGGKPVLLAALPVDRVEPTPYQRDPSDPHVKRLMTVIEKVGQFLDPVIAVHQAGGYWTPNGNHRLQALKKLGARSVVALVLPSPDIAFRILALNTEKAHNLREKSLEVIRMARELARVSRRPESDYAFEFEQAPYLTLGAAYQLRPRLSGGAYHPLLRRIEEFLDDAVAAALKVRERRAGVLLEIDDAVTGIVAALKERGLTSPYLRPFVVARINPIRFSKATSFDAEQVLAKTLAAAGKFNVDRVRQEDVVRAGGGSADEE